MGLEAATFIHQLNPANPVGAVDPKAQGDDHLRLIKSTLQATFPNITGAVTATQAQLNGTSVSAAPVNDVSLAAPSAGVATSFIRTDAQLRLSEAIAPTWTGQHNWNLSLRAPNGSAAAPAVAFSNSNDMGMYRFNATQLGFATAGVYRASFSALFADFTGCAQLFTAFGTVAAPAFSFAGDPDLGWYRVAADDIGCSANGVRQFSISNTRIFANVQYRGPDGTAGAPTISFDSDPNTGSFSAGPDVYGIATGAILRFEVSTTAVRSHLPNVGVDGTALAPSYSWASDPDTGLFWLASGRAAFSCNNSQVVTFESFANGSLTVADYGGASQVVGFRNIPQNSQSANYTTVLGDAGKHLLHPNGGGAGDTFTIAANSAVAYPLGTAITFVNRDSNTLAININTDTLILAGTASTGARVLAQNGVATAIKVGNTEWIISGSGLS